MTATTVSGIAVIASEPAISTIRTRDDQPIHFVQILRLLLEDGSTTFGCIHCDFTGASPAAIRPHLRVHVDPATRPTTGRAAAKTMTLDQLIARVADLKRIEGERDGWKARALDAEKKLTTLRNALKG